MASLVVRVISLWLVIASQKVVHIVCNKIAKFVVPLRKETKDSLPD